MREARFSQGGIIDFKSAQIIQIEIAARMISIPLLIPL